jgi:hypothetical protein
MLQIKELRRSDVDAYTMIQGLRGMFENQARAERYNISKDLFMCKLVAGSLVM